MGVGLGRALSWREGLASLSSDLPGSGTSANWPPDTQWTWKMGLYLFHYSLGAGACQPWASRSLEGQERTPGMGNY